MTLMKLGHSFPKAEPAPLARPPLLKPASLQLVASAPPLSAYATLVVQRRGPPPLMFKFVPPSKSNFEVKPQQGIIETKFQIVVVQLIPSPCKEFYMESWRLQLNGSDQNEVPVVMVGQAEYPAVEVGVKNVVSLPPTFPGCLQILRVPLRNFTRQGVRYYLCVLNNVQTVKVDDPYGSIASNEVLYTTWHFRPPVQGYYKVALMCEVTAVDSQGTALSCKTETPVMAHGVIDLTYLTLQVPCFCVAQAYPDVLSLGTLSWGSQGCDSLLLFNPGRAPIHFALRMTARSALTVSSDVTLTPTIGTLEAGARLSIQVVVRPRETGLHVLEVSYRVRRGPDPQEPLLAMQDQPLSKITYYCEVPTIKVVDIRAVDPGPLYSKACLWDLLGLDELCEVLRRGEPCSVQQVDLRLPETLVGSAPLRLGLLLRGAGRLPAAWRLRRCKICDCQSDSVSAGISRRRKVLRCPHRHLLDLQPRAGCLTVQQQQVLAVEVCYELEGTTELVWELSLPAGRSVVLRWRLVALPRLAAMPTLYRDACCLGHVYVGDLSPVAQVVWLYNATSMKAEYNVDVEPLETLGQQQGCQLLSCLNPRGLLPPFTPWPLLFRLAPTQLRYYSETVEVMLGSGEDARRCLLTASGEGVVSLGGARPHSLAPACYLFDQREAAPLPPPSPHALPPAAPAPPVRLSADLITLHALPTYATAHRIFFINNTTSDTIYSYKWQQ
ncbi:cilia- and flagella-associated protein 65 [Schistocerca serialis cubense]|uniref:cilia- and flagella-associated protein 65 n=1 Tax=Schistocerca serialis cubense TaxID=2023355 RepID=UPI00214E9F36|nr:cilia- and flagella-associated protein 65 [Schistocerca serialis cubense]